MLVWALIFFTVVIIARLFGFPDVVQVSPVIAEALFLAFLAGLLALLVSGRGGRKPRRQ